MTAKSKRNEIVLKGLFISAKAKSYLFVPTKPKYSQSKTR